MKLSCCFPSASSDAKARVLAMAQAQRFLEDDAIEIFGVGGGALGITRGTERHSPVPFVHASPAGNVLVMSGTPFRSGATLARHLRDAVARDLDAATRALADVDGPFVALFWDAASQRLAIVTDPLGTMPFYFAHSETGFVAATEMKAFAASGLVPPAPDLAAWGSFLTFGNFVGDRTWLAAVRRAPIAGIVVYEPRSNTLSSATHWHFPAPRPARSVDAVELAPIVEAVRDDVRACFEHTGANTGTVLLSGGFDSRMLAAILLEEGRRPSVLQLDHPDELFDTDGRFARAAARRLGLAYERRTPPADFFASAGYIDYLVANEVSTRSLGLFIAQLSTHIASSHRTVWEGVALGNFLAPPGAASALKLSAYVASASRPWSSRTWQAARRLFGEARAAAMRDAAAQILDTEVSALPDTCESRVQFVLRNRMRARTATNPLKVYGNLALPLTPGLSRALADACATIPYAQSAFGLYLRIYRRYFRVAGRAPFCSGGALIAPAVGGRGVPFVLAKAATTAVGRRVVQRWQRRFGGATAAVAPLALVDRVVQRAEPHEWLDEAAVAAAGRDDTPEGLELRRLLFYWQMSRWVLEGRLARTRSPLRDALLDGLPGTP